ncbi:hypothetical protein V1477_009047, partial [Vespula maculifrons]
LSKKSDCSRHTLLLAEAEADFGQVLKYTAIRSVVLAIYRYYMASTCHIISVYRKYYRPRSHHVEVAAFGDPRANGDSTLKFARPACSNNRRSIKRSPRNQTKSFTVGLLIAPENTTSVPADTGMSVLPILPVFASSNRL